jgi:hypothetical protein
MPKIGGKGGSRGRSSSSRSRSSSRSYSSRGNSSKRRAALSRRRGRSRANQIVVPVKINSEYHRYFEYNDETSQWDTSAYDQVMLRGLVSLDQINNFLAKIMAIPVPDEPCCLSLCPGDYFTKIETLKKELE